MSTVASGACARCPCRWPRRRTRTAAAAVGATPTTWVLVVVRPCSWHAASARTRGCTTSRRGGVSRRGCGTPVWAPRRSPHAPSSRDAGTVVAREGAEAEAAVAAAAVVVTVVKVRVALVEETEEVLVLTTPSTTHRFLRSAPPPVSSRSRAHSAYTHVRAHTYTLRHIRARARAHTHTCTPTPKHTQGPQRQHRRATPIPGAPIVRPLPLALPLPPHVAIRDQGRQINPTHTACIHHLSRFNRIRS